MIFRTLLLTIFTINLSSSVIPEYKAKYKFERDDFSITGIRELKKSNNDDADSNGPTSRQFRFKCSKCPAEFPLQNITDICEHVLTESSKQQLEMGIHNSTSGGVVGGGRLAKFSRKI